MKKSHIQLKFSLLFCFIAAAMYYWFYSANRTLIFAGDAYSQHIKAYTYYGMYLRGILTNLVREHRLILPAWEWGLGEGGDILQTLHYYCIGDPIAALNVLVPAKYTWIFYEFSIFLRMYLAGLAFLHLTDRLPEISISEFGAIAGALTYTFCDWMLLHATRNPFFLNPLITLPLLILGVEYIRLERSGRLMTLAVFLTAISNFYFFYISVLLIVIYVFVRLIVFTVSSLRTQKENPARVKETLRICVRFVMRLALYSVLGTMLSGIVLLPSLAAFLGDSRMGDYLTIPALYPAEYYRTLLGIFFSMAPEELHQNYTTLLGYGVIAVPSVSLLFLRKKNVFVKALYAACLLILLSPFAGHLLNGMSYAANRWSWGFSLLVAFTVSLMWDELFALDGRQLFAVTGISAVCGIVSVLLWDDLYPVYSLAASLILLGMLLIILLGTRFVRKGNSKFLHLLPQLLALVLILISVYCNGMYRYTDKGRNILASCIDTYTYTDYRYYDYQAIEGLMKADKVTEPTRYTGRIVQTNGNLLVGISGTNYYWTLSNANLSIYRKGLELLEPHFCMYWSYDDRIIPILLSNTAYYVESEGSVIPYGFEQTTEGGYDRLTLSHAFAHTSASLLSREDYDSLDAVARQEALLEAVVLDEEDADSLNVSLNQITSDDLTIERTYGGYSVLSANGVSFTGNSFVIDAPGSSVTLALSDADAAETYLIFHDFDYLPPEGETTDNIILTLSNDLGLAKNLEYEAANNKYYEDYHDFTVNLGYREQSADTVTITFSEAGTVVFSELLYAALPTADLGERAGEMNRETLTNITLETDHIAGSVSAEKDCILVLSLPFSKGWSALVDGTETDLINANIAYTGLPLSAGDHQIELIYHTPFKTMGLIVSLLGLVLCIAVFAIYKKKSDR